MAYLTAEDLVTEARRNPDTDYFQDLVGLGDEIMRIKNATVVQDEMKANLAAEALLLYGQLGRENGRANNHQHPLDYLTSAKEYMRQWAARQHTGDSYQDWDLARRSFAECLECLV